MTNCIQYLDLSHRFSGRNKERIKNKGIRSKGRVRDMDHKKEIRKLLDKMGDRELILVYWHINGLLGMK